MQFVFFLTLSFFLNVSINLKADEEPPCSSYLDETSPLDKMDFQNDEEIFTRIAEIIPNATLSLECCRRSTPHPDDFMIQLNSLNKEFKTLSINNLEGEIKVRDSVRDVELAYFNFRYVPKWNLFSADFLFVDHTYRRKHVAQYLLALAINRFPKTKLVFGVFTSDNKKILDDSLDIRQSPFYKAASKLGFKEIIWHSDIKNEHTNVLLSSVSHRNYK